jgi:putative transposase
MIPFFRHFIGWIVAVFRSREDLILENLALRQQLLALKAKRPRRRLSTAHKLFWIGLLRLWSGWKRSLVLVTPRTVVAWHRAGFRLYWKWLSGARRVGGRNCVSREIQSLIFRMASENSTWGAPRIHGELLKLGFDVSEPTVSRWLRRIRQTTDPSQRWLTFLRNHRDAIAAMDFFTVPTLTFGVLYCFFVIGHDRRKILCFNVTKHPSAFWIVQQMREAWPYRAAHKFCCSTATPSLATTCYCSQEKWEACQCELLSAALGRTELLNAGSEVAEGTCWITSSSSMNDTSSD